MTVDGKIQLSMVLRSFAAAGSRQLELTSFARPRRSTGPESIGWPVSDHVVVRREPGRLRPPRDRRAGRRHQPTGPDGHWLEPITLLSLLAGRTSRIRLATNVLIAALRRPVDAGQVRSDARRVVGREAGPWRRGGVAARGIRRRGRRVRPPGRGAGRHVGDLPRIVVTNARRFHVADAALRTDTHDAETAAGRWGTHLGERQRQPARGPAPRSLRSSVDPWLGPAADLAAEVARMRDALDRAGGEPASLQSGGHPAATCRNEDGRLDIAGTVAGVPGLIAAGATDVRLTLRVPDDPVQHFDQVSAVVAAFRAVTS